MRHRRRTARPAGALAAATVAATVVAVAPAGPAQALTGGWCAGIARLAVGGHSPAWPGALVAYGVPFTVTHDCLTAGTHTQVRFSGTFGSYSCGFVDGLAPAPGPAFNNAPTDVYGGRTVVDVWPGGVMTLTPAGDGVYTSAAVGAGEFVVASCTLGQAAEYFGYLTLTWGRAGPA